MKTIYSMGNNKYVHMDSYDNSLEARLWSIGVALFTLAITTISATALVGVDITQLNPQTQQRQTNVSR